MMIRQCIGGSPAPDGICAEHGETACVVSMTVVAPADLDLEKEMA